MIKELNSILIGLQADQEIGKAIDFLSDRMFFTYVYMLLMREIIENAENYENPSEVLRGIQTYHDSIGKIVKNIEEKR